MHPSGRWFGRRTGGRPDDQFWLNNNFLLKFCLPFNLLDQCLRSDLSHSLQWLPDRRQLGARENRHRHIVETYNRDVLGHNQSGFLESPDGTNCREVVISE